MHSILYVPLVSLRYQLFYFLLVYRLRRKGKRFAPFRAATNVEDTTNPFKFADLYFSYILFL